MYNQLLENSLEFLKKRDYYRAYRLLYKYVKEYPENKTSLCYLALYAIVTGSDNVSKLYLKKVGKDIFREFLFENMDDQLVDLLFHNKEEHKRWENYRRPRNQNEINRFGVTAPLCTGDVLEVGCANGNLSGIIGMHADRLFGLDIDPVAIELARHNMYEQHIDNCFFNLGDGADLNYEDNSFDTVVLAEVLEHVPDPYPFVLEAYRVCRPGGKVFISVPKGYSIPDPDHVRIFTKEKLEETVLSATGRSLNWIDEVPTPWLFGSIDVLKKDKKHRTVKTFDFLPSHKLPLLNEDKKVTVIIPTYNRVDFLQESLKSILRQTYKNMEIIVVDDGSTDGTKELVATYENVIYLRKDNGGKSSAINFAFKYATGDYIWIFDDDDIALPKKLELQMRMFQSDSTLDFIHTSAIFMQENNGKKVYFGMHQAEHISQENLLSEQLKGNHFFTPSVIAKIDVYKRTGDWNESLTRAQDYEMWNRICLHSKVGHLQLPTLFYRFHSRTRGTEEEVIQEGDLRSSTKKYHRKVVKGIHKLPIDKVFPTANSPSTVHLIESYLERALYLEDNHLIEECREDLSKAKKIALDSGEKYLNLTSKGIQLINLLDKKMSEWGEAKSTMDILFFMKMIKHANM
jgi:glycosyltransferase involved in cell wall biosynthesis/2-polyprenyl-3-methyl-5-hydroxy-6-metoxy-1,4-benzoquinol methylase